jgi:hypothetical protein
LARPHPGDQALLVLAHLRKGETYTDLAIGFGIGTTTVFRYVREALEVLEAKAPGFRDPITRLPADSLMSRHRFMRVPLAAGEWIGAAGVLVSGDRDRL